MSRQEALAEARRRWGPRAQARAPMLRAGPLSLFCVYADEPIYSGGKVGRLPGVSGFRAVAKGEGPSWEAAFADADVREAAEDFQMDYGFGEKEAQP